MIFSTLLSFFFFFNDTATTEIYTLSLHDALPICGLPCASGSVKSGALSEATKLFCASARGPKYQTLFSGRALRSEEHTSELQSQSNLVCRLLLEKKKKKKKVREHNTCVTRMTRRI